MTNLSDHCLQYKFKEQALHIIEELGGAVREDGIQSVAVAEVLLNTLDIRDEDGKRIDGNAREILYKETLDIVCKQLQCTHSEYFALQNIFIFQVAVAHFMLHRKPMPMYIATNKFGNVIAPWDCTHMPPSPSELLLIKAKIHHPESEMRGLTFLKKAKNPTREARALGAALTEMLRDTRDAYVPEGVTSHYPERILNNTLLQRENQRRSARMSKIGKQGGDANVANRKAELGEAGTHAYV